MKKTNRLISEKEIQKKVKELARQIDRDYAQKELIVIGVLKGAFVFLADLVRHVSVPLKIDFLQAQSYGSAAVSSGKVNIIKDIDTDIQGKQVLLVEDIIDTGYTLDHLLKFLSKKDPASLKTCVLLDKAGCRKVNVPVDYVGFEIEDKFVVGYGLDKAEKHRNLPYIEEFCKELF